MAERDTIYIGHINKAYIGSYDANGLYEVVKRDVTLIVLACYSRET